MLQVSIIIVTYNTLGITRQCIDSIYGHTEGVDFEVIVIDNASSDGTRQVLENDSRIRYIYSSKNLGFGRANNLGMREAKGKYLFLLNSDTLLLNNAVRILYEAAESYTGKLGVMGTILQFAVRPVRTDISQADSQKIRNLQSGNTRIAGKGRIRFRSGHVSAKTGIRDYGRIRFGFFHVCGRRRVAIPDGESGLRPRNHSGTAHNTPRRSERRFDAQRVELYEVVQCDEQPHDLY